MRLSYTELWNDAVALLRVHGGLAGAVAGAFLFLPSALLGYFFPFEQRGQDGLVWQVLEHLRDHWPWMLAGNLLEMLGAIVIYSLFLKSDGRTVAVAILASLGVLPSYLVASIAGNLIIFAGLAALIVPGLYLFARLAPLGAVIVAEDRRNPFEAIGRSFALTRGHGWSVLGIFVIVYAAGLVVNLAATAALGSLFIVLAGRELGSFLSLLVGAAVTAALGVIVLALSAAVYRKLRALAPESEAARTGT